MSINLAKKVLFWAFFGGLALLTITYNLDWVLRSDTSYYDLGSFIAAGQLAARGENPYSIDAPYIFEVEFEQAGISGIAPNLNPPVSVLLFKEIRLIPPGTLLAQSRIFSFALFSVLVFMLSAAKKQKNRKWFLILFSFSLAGMWHTLQLGQIYILLLALVVGALHFLRKKNYWAAGVFLGLTAAIKPNFLYWNLILAVCGYLKTFLVSGMVFSLVSSIPLLKYGTGIYSQWLDASIKYGPDLLLFPGNNSLQSLAARFDLSGAGTSLSAAAAIAIMLFVWKYKPGENAINLTAITATLLISPVAWTGYTILLLPVLWFLDEWKAEHWLTGAILCVPFLFILENFEKSFAHFIFFGWFYGWGLVILLTATVLRAVRGLPRTQ